MALYTFWGLYFCYWFGLRCSGKDGHGQLPKLRTLREESGDVAGLEVPPVRQLNREVLERIRKSQKEIANREYIYIYIFMYIHINIFKYRHVRQDQDDLRPAS